jgi:hypothetical protein
VVDAYAVWTILYPVLVGVLSFFVVAYRWKRTAWVKRGVDRLFRVGHGGILDRLDWRHLSAAVFALFVVVAVFDYEQGFLNCGNGGVSDTIAQWASGHAFLFGGNPFQPPACGSSIPVPYGIAAVLIDAVGSLGGPLGIWLIWDALAVLVIPLTWFLAGPDRRYVTIVVVTSLLYIPLVAAQIDGATNVFVVVAVLGSLWLARRTWTGAAALGGFLSTARFPSLFPIVGATGRAGRERWTAPAVAVAVFGALTLASYFAWGSAFSNPVFFAQVSRTSGSINAFGVLIQNGWLPQSTWVTAFQAAVILVIVEEVHRRRFAPLEAAGIVLVGIALTTQFLSFNILSWLLPVALLGVVAQRWLFVVAVVGTINYDLAFNVYALQYGIWWPSEILDILLTLILAVLLVSLWIEAARAAPPRTTMSPSARPAPETPL